jgi:hypothetical protein
VIVEKRSLTRRTSLEQHMQSALDSVRAEVIDDAVSDAMNVVEGIPADLRMKALQKLRQRVCEALGHQEKAMPAVALLTPRERAEAVFGGRDAA